MSSVGSADMYASLAQQFADLSDQHAKLSTAYANVKRDNDSLRMRLGENVRNDDSFAVNDGFYHKKRRSNSGHVERHDLVVFQITFPAHIMKLMSELFGVLDTQKQGYITEESFTAGHYQDFFQSFGAWSQLKQYFDANGNNAIDPQEFINGFALMAFNEVISVGCQISILDFQREMQALIAAFAENKIYTCNALVRDHLGQSSLGLRRVASSQMPSPVVYVANLSDGIVLEMSAIFKALLGQGATGNGEITADSIRRAGLDLSKWQQLQQMFDEDASGLFTHLHL